MTGRSNRTRLLGGVALAAACALVWSGAATAQQSGTPNELWQEYPLNPEPGSPAPTRSVPQGPSSRGGGEQAGGGGDDGGAAAADEEPFPLVQVALALGLLALGILHGVFVLARRRGVPERVRELIGAVRSTPRPSARRLSYASRRNPAGSPAQGTQQRPNASPAAPGRAERAQVAEERAEVAEEPVKVAEERVEVAEERVEVAEERVEVAEEPVEAAEAPAEPAGKPVKPPKPKVPPTPPAKPSAHKPPPAKPPTAKPPRAKPARAAKPARPAKPVPTAKRVPAAKPAPAAKRPKPARPARPKTPAPKKSRAERPARSEQPPPATPDEGRDGLLTCSIYWWRDGPVADFYALATGRQGRAWVVERSPRFEWLAGDFPPEAREAHAALVEALVTDGWRQVGTEGVWYRQRFERPFAESS